MNIPPDHVQVDLTFYHTRIANRSWATRRLRQLMDAVQISATVANPIGGQIIMDVFCQPGCDASTAAIYLTNFDAGQVEEFVKSLNRHRGVGAKLVKNILQPA